MFGKVLFAIADIGAGWLLIRILASPPASGSTQASHERRDAAKHPADASQSTNTTSNAAALRAASLWLLNPMVATISTRGNAEGLLALVVLASLHALLRRRVLLAGTLLGAAVHFKIYPAIYGPTYLLFLRPASAPALRHDPSGWLRAQLTRERVSLSVAALTSFAVLTATAYAAYGDEYITHAWSYHLSRSDHRHNFSPYQPLLYLFSAAAASPSTTTSAGSSWLAQHLPTLGFVPQLLLSGVLLPFALLGPFRPLPSTSPSAAGEHAWLQAAVPSTMLAQTLAFVALNKVCTSQYFVWYLCLLPLHVAARSKAARRDDEPVRWQRDAVLGAAWVGAQAWWLGEAYRLEFLGERRFVPGLWMAGLAFYAVNMGLVGVVVEDVGCLR